LASGIGCGNYFAVNFGNTNHAISAQSAGQTTIMNKSSRFVFSSLCFGFAFLYVPILVLVVYSFNQSAITSVWGGFSLRWYFALFNNEQIIDAALLSLRIAAVSATFATILGTMAGLALAQMGRYRGRLLFTGLIAAPLVMPEVITGLSLLLMFVSLQELVGWPMSRGASTITIAHITFSMAYVAVIVQSRLSSMDQSLQEAAMDLGGRPIQVAFDITFPLIAPSMLSGWLLAFTLSLDDLVIASFTSGAGASTLPMIIFSKIKLGVTPDINALATIIIGIVGLGITIASWIMLKQSKHKKTG
jgi:putrescine transport system permease protein